MAYTSVDEFLSELSDDRRQQVEALRTIIKNINPNLTEHIKWNSPSYVLDGEDRITFNMHYPDQTMILIHMGATRKEDKKGTPILSDDLGLVKWNSDIRGTLSFKTLDEIVANEDKIITLLKNWLSIK